MMENEKPWGSLREDLTRSLGECRETHISWVFLGPQEVFKVKKPVALGFLDFSTPAKRKAACEAEDLLNRRLAPDVYRGIAPVRRDAAGRHAVDGPGETVDWAVRMRRLPDGARADALLETGRLGPPEVRRVAEVLADFHAGARCDEKTSAFGSLERIRHNLAENFAQSRQFPLPEVPPSLLAEAERGQTRFLEEKTWFLESRRRAGRVRDGHGDLRLEQIYLEDNNVLVLDCVEFTERFRYADVAADIAFFSMDLRRRGRPDLAETFLAAYARASGDYGIYPVIDFYESYRAHVRAKVAAILAHDSEADAGSRDRARDEARRFMELAASALRPPAARPRLVAVGGLIASGKSAVADALSERVAAPVVDSDRTRKRLLGYAPNISLASKPWSGAYAEDVSRRVYAALLEAAEGILASGRSVILDATFGRKEDRRAARDSARRLQAPFLFLECRADPAVSLARLRGRAGQPGVSDAREPLWEALRARWEPVDELAPEEHGVLDTNQTLSRTLSAASHVLSAGGKEMVK